MTSVKAKLTVTLKANEVLVAEVDDAILWQRVLNEINRVNSTPPGVASESVLPALEAPGLTTPPKAPSGGSHLDKFAREIGLDRAAIEGALSPTTEAPYLHLNAHNWEAMRKQLPSRGGSAISPIGAAATLLALWFRIAQLGNPTQAQAKALLSEISIEDKNASRGVRGATWLIARAGGQIQVNASEISTAVKLTKAFCSKSWGDWVKGKSE